MNRKRTPTVLQRQLQSASSLWERLPILVELAGDRSLDNTDANHQYGVEALTLARELNDPFWIARSMLAIGTALVPTSRYSEILYYLEEASKMFANLNHSPLKAETDFSIAKIYITMHQVDKALPLLTQSLLVFRNADRPKWIARATAELGGIHVAIGDYGKALECCYQAMDIAVRAGIKELMGTFYAQLAAIYRRIGDSRNTELYLFKTLAAHRTQKDKGGIAVALANIATFYIDQKEFILAEPYIQESTTLYHELGYTAHKAMSLGKMSVIYCNRNDFAGAFRCFRTALSLCRQCEDKLTQGKLYETLGVLCYERGRHSHCLAYFLKALAILERHGDKHYLHQIHRMLGHIYEELGDKPNALRHFKEFHRIKNEDVSIETCRETTHTEIRAELQKLTEQISEEISKSNALKKDIEEREARLVSLTLKLVQREETRRKEATGDDPGKNTSNDIAPENWEIFARQFHQVHHSFYPNLVRNFSSLTPTEIKVCSLIRTGLSSREIAAILCVSKRTVDNHRLSIHKKILLPSGTSLSEFIMRI